VEKAYADFPLIRSSVTATLSSGSCAHVLRLAGYSSPVRVIPRNPCIHNEGQLISAHCLCSRSILGPAPHGVVPLPARISSGNRLAELQDNKNYPFETQIRSGVSFIHIYLFLYKSSDAWFNQNSSIKKI